MVLYNQLKLLASTITYQLHKTKLFGRVALKKVFTFLTWLPLPTFWQEWPQNIHPNQQICLSELKMADLQMFCMEVGQRSLYIFIKHYRKRLCSCLKGRFHLIGIVCVSPIARTWITWILYWNLYVQNWFVQMQKLRLTCLYSHC